MTMVRSRRKHLAVPRECYAVHHILGWISTRFTCFGGFGNYIACLGVVHHENIGDRHEEQGSLCLNRIRTWIKGAGPHGVGIGWFRFGLYAIKLVRFLRTTFVWLTCFLKIWRAESAYPIRYICIQRSLWIRTNIKTSERLHNGLFLMCVGLVLFFPSRCLCGRYSPLRLSWHTSVPFLCIVVDCGLWS
jgi:hypothetical protein